MQTLYRPCTWGEEASRYASHASVTLSADNPVQDPLYSPFALRLVGPEQTLYRPCTGCQLPLTALAFWSRCQALQRPVQALYRVSVTKAAILVVRPLPEVGRLQRGVQGLCRVRACGPRLLLTDTRDCSGATQHSTVGCRVVSQGKRVAAGIVLEWRRAAVI